MTTPIEVNDVVTLLKVREKAQREGVTNNPPSVANQLDAAQTSIVAHFEKALREIRQLTTEKQNKYALERSQLSNEINLETDKHEYQNLTDQIEPFIQNLSLRYNDKLSKAKESEERSIRHLRFFLAKNDLFGRPAKYPDSLIHHFSIIAIITFIEWISLSFFYAEGSDFGIVGGIIIAAFFSLLNLSIAILIGILCRYFNHKILTQKILGGLACLILFCAFSFTTSIAAHYRNATIERNIQKQQAISENNQGQNHVNRSQRTSDESWQAARLAWERFREAPSGFNNVLTWIMVVAAFMFGIFAAYKGYRMDDPYPGYGSLDKDVKCKQATYDHQKNEFREEILSHLNNIRSKQSQILDNAIRNIRRYNQYLNDSENISNELNAKIETIKKNCYTVIKIYREENISIRTADAPTYFETDVELDPSILMQLEGASETEKQLYDEYKNHLDEFNRLAQENRALLQNKTTVALERYQALIASLERDIKEKLDRETRITI